VARPQFDPQYLLAKAVPPHTGAGDDTNRYELLDRKLVITPMQPTGYQRSAQAISTTINENVSGDVIALQYMYLSPGMAHFLQPTVTVFDSRHTRGEDTSIAVQDIKIVIDVVPTIVDEEVRKAKHAAYAAAGLEYWEVDWKGRSLLVHHPDGSTTGPLGENDRWPDAAIGGATTDRRRLVDYLFS
jgi:hypothetical protein